MSEALERGMKLVVIDPRQTDVAQRATLHLQPRPGEDIALVSAMISVILNDELYDREFVAENVSGLEALKAAVAPFTPETAGRRAEVAAEDIISAARIFGAA